MFCNSICGTNEVDESVKQLQTGDSFTLHYNGSPQLSVWEKQTFLYWYWAQGAAALIYIGFSYHIHTDQLEFLIALWEPLVEQTCWVWSTFCTISRTICGATLLKGNWLSLMECRNEDIWTWYSCFQISALCKETSF